jgi:hypothetical protein
MCPGLDPHRDSLSCGLYQESMYDLVPVPPHIRSMHAGTSPLPASACLDLRRDCPRPLGFCLGRCVLAGRRVGGVCIFGRDNQALGLRDGSSAPHA